MQVTEDSVHLVEPAGLLPACSWHPSSPSFKAQHAATAGMVVTVASESTMVLLALEAPTARQATCGASKAKRTALNEVYRLRIDDGPVSALGMRSLGNSAKDEEDGGGAEGGGGGGGEGDGGE